MEILLSFLAGFLVAAVIAFLVVFFIVRDVRGQLRSTRDEAAQRLAETKADLERRNADALEASEQSHKAALEASNLAHKAAMDAVQKRFDETVAKLSAQVKADTNEMLKARQKEFSEASSLSIGQIVTPLRENIDSLKKAMEEENKDQARRSGEMSAHIRNLMEQSEAARRSADQLASALKRGRQVQGGWGETILEELLSSQGLTKGVHFDTQAVIRDASGKVVRSDDNRTMRPDVILHLDTRREVIIDSKVSLTAYIDYVNAENEDDRQKFLKEHIDSVKKHVKELAAVDYSSFIQSPKVSAGYVIMFVPNIGALWTALNAEPDLWRKAADANVYIVDEQSLYATLKLVNVNWTQISQAQNHKKVFDLADEMIKRVGMFMKQYNAIGDALKNANKAYGDGLDKLSPRGQSILTVSSQLIKLGAKTNVKYPLPELVDVDDIPALPELLVDADVDAAPAEPVD